MFKVKELIRVNSVLAVLEANEGGMKVTMEFVCYKVKDGKLVKLDIKPNPETVNGLKRAMKDERLKDKKALVSKLIPNYYL